MQWVGGGFVTLIIYATQASLVDDSFGILTEASFNLLDEIGNNLDVEHS